MEAFDLSPNALEGAGSLDIEGRGKAELARTGSPVGVRSAAETEVGAGAGRAGARGVASFPTFEGSGLNSAGRWMDAAASFGTLGVSTNFHPAIPCQYSCSSKHLGRRTQWIGIEPKIFGRIVDAFSKPAMYSH